MSGYSSRVVHVDAADGTLLNARLIECNKGDIGFLYDAGGTEVSSYCCGNAC